MDTRVAVISIVVEKIESVPEVNNILSLYGNYIIGRLGIPFHEKKINIISVVVDAPQNITNSLSGKIGKIDGINANTLFCNI